MSASLTSETPVRIKLSIAQITGILAPMAVLIASAGFVGWLALHDLGIKVEGLSRSVQQFNETQKEALKERQHLMLDIAELKGRLSAEGLAPPERPRQ